MSFGSIITAIDGFVWGVPLCIFIIAVGVWLTIRIKGTQFSKLGLALKYMFQNEEGGEGEVSSFGALCTALSATIGTGNIVGVATAVVAGGPGALFWMWVAALFGMATKYAEGLLAVKFRVIDEDGHALGGPFYYIEKGMGPKWKWFAKLFAFFGALAGLMGIGTITQVNGITSAINTFFDPDNANTISLFGTDYSIAVVIGAIVVTLFVALVLIGGIKRITSVSSIVVPFMAVIYIICGLMILILNIGKIPAAFALIIQSAFGLRAAAGGAIGAMFMAMQKGVARGIFSNEAGLGSAPIAAAAAQTNDCARQGLVTMTGTFIDTIVICTMTGLSIILTGAYDMGLEGVNVTIKAFELGLPFNNTVCSFLLMLCLAFFAFTTILGWDYYSERCLEYLVKKDNVADKAADKKRVNTWLLVFRWLYILAVLIGPFLTLSVVWEIADIFNALMALPNVIALFALSGVVVVETNAYLSKLKSEKKATE